MVKRNAPTATSWDRGAAYAIPKMTICKAPDRFGRSLPSNDDREVSEKTKSEGRAGNGSPFKVGSELHTAEFSKHR